MQLTPANFATQWSNMENVAQYAPQKFANLVKCKWQARDTHVSILQHADGLVNVPEEEAELPYLALYFTTYVRMGRARL